MAMARKVTIELLDEIQDGFNRQDVDAILSHFVEDCEWLMARGPDAPQGRRCRGKAEIADVLRSRYGQIPDMRWEEMRHWICDQSKALSEWVVRGTPVGGEPFEFLGCDLWEFRDGYVAKKDTYWKYIG
jgi:taurine dehydrogenase small subunit